MTVCTLLKHHLIDRSCKDNKSRTPLSIAIMLGNREIIQVLGPHITHHDQCDPLATTNTIPFYTAQVYSAEDLLEPLESTRMRWPSPERWSSPELDTALQSLEF